MPPSFFQRMTGRIKAAPVVTPTPTEDELKADQEVVQKAISEAVTTALNNDDFTKAVAVHLATQLQPALKSALNIATVEENLSRRLDEIQTATTARLADLSNDVNNSSSTDKTAALEDAVSQINVLLAALGKDVKAVQEQIAQQDATILSIHSEKLDALSTHLKAVQQQVASPDTSLLSSHTTKLDAITAEVAAVKQSTEVTTALKTITSDLATIKTELETGSTSTSTEISGLNAKIASVQSAIEAQTTTLSEVKASDASPEILAGIKSSNESHTSHAAALSAIAPKDHSADLAELKSQVAALSSTVSELKTADVSPEILSAVKSSNELHAAHTTTLAEIKTATSTPTPVAEKVDLTTIETDVKTILTTLESQTTTLSEIKTVASTPATAAEKTDITGLEANVKTLLSNLESHSGSIAELKTSSGASGAKILAAITAQDAILAELKDAKSPEVLTAIGVLQTEIAASKSELTATHESVNVIVHALPKVGNDEVLAEVKAVKTAVVGIEIPKHDNSEVISEIKAAVAGIEIPKYDNTEVLTEVKAVKAAVAGIEIPKHDNFEVISEVKAAVAGIEIPKYDNTEVLTEVKAVKAAVAGIDIPKYDNTEIINEVKAVKTLVSETKEPEILAEVKEIKVLVEKSAVVTKVEEVGENDKGVEVKENGSNGVEAKEEVVEA